MRVHARARARHADSEKTRGLLNSCETPPALTKIASEFRDVYDMSMTESMPEAQRFYEFNQARGWDCLPDWRVAAERWNEQKINKKVAEAAERIFNMAREKKYFEWEIPTSVVRIIRAICADYERRETAIKYSGITGAVLLRYVEINAVIDRALEEVEKGIRYDLLFDIAQGRGYGRSHTQCVVSKNTYYRRRRKLIYDVAKGLSLL